MYSLKFKTKKLTLLSIVIKIPCWIFIFISLFALLSSKPIYAKNNITVSPQLIQLDLSQDLPEAEYTYTNNTNQVIELKLSMQDVKSLEEEGIPGIIDPNVTRDYNYGLSSWARFSTQNLVINPGQSKSVKVYIDKNRLTLGGHYGTVLAELIQNNTQESVKLRAILSSLLFVRSGTENEQERANIVQIYSDAGITSFPKSVTFRFQNSGNVDLTPYGTISIINPAGDEVGHGIINSDSLITLPGSTRKYTVNIKRYADILLPGIYKTKIDLRYGKSRFKVNEDSYFFMLMELNKGMILSGSVIVFLILAIIIRKKRKQ